MSAERGCRQPSLELEFEKMYLQLLLPRAGTARRRGKRYVGVIGGGNDNEVEFIGMEVVRRDGRRLQTGQRELYQRTVLHDQSVDELSRGHR